MAQTTRSSAASGSGSSKPAGRSAGGAGSRSGRGNRGISATTTTTGPNTGDRNIEQRIELPPAAADAVALELTVIGSSGEVGRYLARSGLAALALEMARQLDDPHNSANAKSMCAAQLRDALSELRALVPPKQEASEIDELRAKREERIAGRKGS